MRSTRRSSPRVGLSKAPLHLACHIGSCALLHWLRRGRATMKAFRSRLQALSDSMSDLMGSGTEKVRRRRQRRLRRAAAGTFGCCRLAAAGIHTRSGGGRRSRGLRRY